MVLISIALMLTYILRRIKMSEFNLEDVLNPRKAWLGNACYRINRKKSNTPKRKMDMSATKTGYTDNEELRCHDDVCDIEVTENGRFRTNIRLPQAFYSYIIGTKGSRRKRLEEETNSNIQVPRQANNNKIVITGPTEKSVVLCRNRLEMIGIDLRKRYSMTHFISFPMVNEQIKENFQKFKQLVLAEGHIDGMSDSIFKKIDKVHLTIGTMVLLDDSEKQEATELLEKCKQEIILPQLASCKPLIIKMKGLEYMNDDPAQVDVLYATVKVENHENPDILQKISDDIVEFFYSQGIMRKENDHVKLHATVINTRYRKDADNDESGSRSRDRRRKRISFDARPILKKYADFDFGEQQLDEIHLSHRYSLDSNGYYNPLHKISCT